MMLYPANSMFPRPDSSLETCRKWIPVLLIVLLGWARPLGATDFYVATDGNDQWSGRLAAPNAANTDGPFATLQQARNEIRHQRQAGSLKEDVTVNVRGGNYLMPNGLKFEPQDSGSETFPVTYRAFKNEHPVLIGGRAITQFTPYKGEILQANMIAEGLKGVYFRQLFFGGRRQILARYPNVDRKNPYYSGWAYADGTLVPKGMTIPGEDKCSFTVKPKDLRTWLHPGGVEVCVFPRYNWWNNFCLIRSIDSPTRRVMLATNASYAIRPGDRYFFQNALEELDTPGEWYLDKTDWTLYFWPPTTLRGKAVVVPTTRTLIELRPGTKYLTIQGFALSYTEGTAVILSATTHCVIAKNTIRNIGDYYGCGASVDGGFGNSISGNDISETGADGILISGGNNNTLTAAKNSAENNYIHHVGVFCKHAAGIRLTGVGNSASHNLIHDGPRIGISFSGNNLLIEFNHIRDMCLETHDAGALYTDGRDWLSSRGSVVKYNYIHDIFGYNRDEQGNWSSPNDAIGIYLDDNAAGVDVFGNIIARCSVAIQLNNGRDNHVGNNILIENQDAQFKYYGWTANSDMWKRLLPTMTECFESASVSPSWRKMRGMRRPPAQVVLPDGKIMAENEFIGNIIYYRNQSARYVKVSDVPFGYNVIDSNLIWHFGQSLLTGQTLHGPASLNGPASLSEWESWQGLGMDRHSVIADPLFNDAARDDYRLKPESPAFEFGFQRIPIEKIGPYDDVLRASWPIVEAEGIREHPFR
jgi:hypothetical protein